MRIFSGFIGLAAILIKKSISLFFHLRRLLKKQLETIPTVEIYYSCDNHTQLIQEINTYLDSHDNMINYASIQDTTAEFKDCFIIIAASLPVIYLSISDLRHCHCMQHKQYGKPTVL